MIYLTNKTADRLAEQAREMGDPMTNEERIAKQTAMRAGGERFAAKLEPRAPYIDVFDEDGNHVGNVDSRLPQAEQDADRARLIARVRCPECRRVFDLSDEIEAGEWFYGHDCEVEG